MMKYTSKYSPGKKVTPGQYITELICEHRASTLQTRLPIKFWRLKGWDDYYKVQIKLANSLLKKYDSISIIRALQDKRTEKLFSFNNQQLEKIIQEYDNRGHRPQT